MPDDGDVGSVEEFCGGTAVGAARRRTPSVSDDGDGWTVVNDSRTDLGLQHG
jgi:hypothetical protein